MCMHDCTIVNYFYIVRFKERKGKRKREMEKNGNILMQKYEMGRLLGQGTFAKVHYARNIMSGHSVAIKIIDKEKVMRIGLIEQIKREISVMRLVRHPNVIKLYEVMASKTKIYFALEYVKGGELFNKVAKGRLNEATSRKYFQQLIAAVDFCHSRGVYHRDLKPENLLLDEDGNLKVSDFGLSALSETRRQDGLLHTTCGTPAYVAPEVINRRGYDGAKADIWSCGVILFVLMAGYLPFHDSNLMEMYKKISRGSFRCPHWFPLEIRKLLSRILDPNPRTRMKVSAIMDNTWFKKGFKPIELPLVQDDSNRASCSNVDTAFSTSETDCSSGKKIESIPSPFSSPTKLSCFNAFHIISLSQGVDLSGLFENHFGPKLEARFTTQKPPSTILSKLEEIASRQSFDVQMKDGTIKMQGNRSGRKGQLGIDFEIFEVTPAFHVVELTKTAGDTMEYKSFCKDGLRPCLQEIVWAWQGNSQQEQPQAT